MQAVHPASRFPLLLVLILAIGLVGGCNQLEGRGQITGELDLPGCEGLQGDFAMDLNFLALEEFGPTGLLIRLQEGGRGLEVTDGLLLTVYDKDEIRKHRGEALPVPAFDPTLQATGGYVRCGQPPGTRPAHCPWLQASLNLPSSCPPSVTAPSLVGEAVFHQLGLEVNERVAGSLELDAMDHLTGSPVGHLSVEFDFVVRQGHPYQRFPK